MASLTSLVRCLALTGFLVIFQLDPYHCQTDPCVGYKLIDMHGGRRESTYQPEPDDQLPCDDDVDPATWTRFVRDDKSYQLTTSNCVQIDHCGTSSPLWIDQRSTHPTVLGVESTVKICMNYGLAFCCSIIGDATVRLCKDPRSSEKFYVYKLPKPHGCYSSYCVDPVTGSCAPKFKRGPNDTCLPYFPPQNRPTLEGPVIDGTTIKFYCAVAYAGSADMKADARFAVTFLFDGIADPRIQVVDADGKAQLDEEHFQGHFGTDISCASQTYWQHDPDTKGDDMRSSDGYFIGVRADNNRIVVSEADGSAKEVVLQATLPVVCKDLVNQPCRACTRVVTEGMTAVGKQCEYCFDPNDSTSSLKVSAVKSTRLGEPAIYFIDFKPFTYKYETSSGGGPDTLWDGYDMNGIQVTYRDSTHGRCSAVADLRTIITSFDGKYYHVYHIGQFLMLKSDAPRHFEIHLRLWQCNPARSIGSCVCAVAVREGDAILGVDRCGSRSSNSIGHIKIMRYSPQSWDIPEEAYVSSDGGLNYYIRMPSGAYVRAETSEFWGLNVYVHGLAEDQSKTSGLCGNFDGNLQNDLIPKGENRPDPQNDLAIPTPVSFTSSYRLKQGESFFDSTPQRANLPDPDITKCRCNQGTIDCSPTADVEGDAKDKDTTETLQKSGKEGGNTSTSTLQVSTKATSSDNGQRDDQDVGTGSTTNAGTESSGTDDKGGVSVAEGNGRNGNDDKGDGADGNEGSLLVPLVVGSVGGAVVILALVALGVCYKIRHKGKHSTEDNAYETPARQSTLRSSDTEENMTPSEYTNLELRSNVYESPMRPNGAGDDMTPSEYTNLEMRNTVYESPRLPSGAGENMAPSEYAKLEKPSIVLREQQPYENVPVAD